MPEGPFYREVNMFHGILRGRRSLAICALVTGDTASGRRY